MNGELNTNDASLNNRFAIYSTPGNAVIYLDEVRALTSGTISKEQGGLMAISVDPFTKPKRTLYYDDTHKQSDGTTLLSLSADWVNIDNALGIVAHNDGKQMAFGDQADNNSILTAKVCTAVMPPAAALSRPDRASTGATWSITATSLPMAHVV